MFNSWQNLFPGCVLHDVGYYVQDVGSPRLFPGPFSSVSTKICQFSQLSFVLSSSCLTETFSTTGKWGKQHLVYWLREGLSRYLQMISCTKLGRLGWGFAHHHPDSKSHIIGVAPHHWKALESGPFPYLQDLEEAGSQRIAKYGEGC